MPRLAHRCDRRRWHRSDDDLEKRRRARGQRRSAVPRQCRTGLVRWPCRSSAGCAFRRRTLRIRHGEGCFTASIDRGAGRTGRSRRADPAPASRPWSICCCGFTRQDGAFDRRARHRPRYPGSLRAHIAMVTQDTSLLHRSIRDTSAGRLQAASGRCGAPRRRPRPRSSRARDWYGRRGFDAHVGERGVKLSGGRGTHRTGSGHPKDAPILGLDEATSSLDSEVEQRSRSSSTV